MTRRIPIQTITGLKLEDVINTIEILPQDVAHAVEMLDTCHDFKEAEQEDE